ncbi:MAG: hypothetical protein Q8S13_09230 [Dehalococcoidia bacterium]|nr:hypothetical protein [Dehalococcoidia bacterium]
MRAHTLLALLLVACGGDAPPEARTLLITVDAATRVPVDALRYASASGGAVYRFTEDLGPTTIPPARTSRSVFPPDRPRAVSVHVEALWEGRVVASGRAEGFLGGAPAYVLLAVQPLTGAADAAQPPDLGAPPDTATPSDTATPDGAPALDTIPSPDAAQPDTRTPTPTPDLDAPDLTNPPDLTHPPDLGAAPSLSDLMPHPPDLALYSKCGHPGDEGDSGGIGRYCGPNATKPCAGSSWCSTGSNAAALRDRYFCTNQCSRDGGKTLDSACGNNSSCWCPQGNLDCWCLPIYCPA